MKVCGHDNSCCVEKSSVIISVLQALLVSEAGGMDGISVVTNTGLEMLCGVGVRRPSGQTDSDHDSVVSDYSEMADPVKEHLAGIHILQEAELRFGSVLGLPVQQPYAMRPWLAVQRRPDEDEVEFLQRQKKINFLSLAQEFAAIKKADPDALPFNLHRPRNDASDEEEGKEESDDVSLAQELATVCCVDKTDDDLSQVGRSCSERVQDDSAFPNTTSSNHISQYSDIVTKSCSSGGFCAAKENCSSELGVVVSNIPDVVQGLHDSAHCDESKQPDTDRVEVDVADNCRLSDALTALGDDFNTSDELANAAMSHSKKIDLVSIILLMTLEDFFLVDSS